MEETKELKKFIGTVRVDNELERYEFKTDGDPVEHLWERYGMSTYIADLEEVTPKAEIELSTDFKDLEEDLTQEEEESDKTQK